MGPGGEPAKTAEAPKAPEKYADFKLPEGLTANKEAIEKFSPLFKESGLSQEQAQKFVDAQVSFEQGLVKAQVAAVDKQNQEWVSALKTEFGSDYDKQTGHAAKGIEGLQIKGLREFLHESGIGNHPLLVKAMAKIGAEFFSEGQTGEGRRDNGQGEKSLGDTLYPGMKGKPDGNYRAG